VTLVIPIDQEKKSLDDIFQSSQSLSYFIEQEDGGIGRINSPWEHPCSKGKFTDHVKKMLPKVVSSKFLAPL